MRIIGALALALSALLAWSGPAAAQDTAQAGVARELERKARAGEPDNGFCLRAAPQLERLDRPAAGARLNQLLSRAAAMRDGQKCRPSMIFACIPGQDCRAKTNSAVCEMKPGQWD